MRFLPLSWFGKFPPRFPFGFQCYTWLFCVVVVQFSHFSCSQHFPLSPFPFPLSPFPFPLSLSLPQSLFFLGHFCCSPIFPISPLWCSKWFLFLCCHVSDCHRCCLPSTTGVQLFSKRGGLCFLFFVALFSLRGRWKAPDSGGGGMGGSRRGFPVKDLVWTTAGGGVI